MISLYILWFASVVMKANLREERGLFMHHFDGITPVGACLPSSWLSLQAITECVVIA